MELIRNILASKLENQTQRVLEGSSVSLAQYGNCCLFSKDWVRNQNLPQSSEFLNSELGL